MKLNRKAQDAANAATLVAIIAGLILLYIIFMPPGEREKLLGENETVANGTTTSNLTLLLVYPGRLEYIGQKEIEHTIPPLNLYTRTEAQIIKSAASLHASSSIFKKNFAALNFDIADLKNTANPTLSFNINKASGRLIIKLNDNVIYDATISSPSKTFYLDKTMLQNKNALEFSVSDVGLAFWRTNQYELEDIKIMADLTDISQQKSSAVFLVSSTEKNNLDRVYVKFTPNCIQSEVGKLNVMINEFNIFSSIPDCGSLRPIEFAPTSVASGENRIYFMTEKGSYLIDNIVVKSQLKEAIYPAYYFELDDAKYNDIASGARKLKLILRFVNDLDYKKGRIYMNGHLTYLDTYNATYERVLSGFAKRGNNAVEIIPGTTLDIRELEIKII